MNKSIVVSSRSRTACRRQLAVYNDEADILEVALRDGAPWLFGIDVDGNIVFDLEQDGALANFDFLIGRRRWKADSLHWTWPLQAPKCDLIFSQESMRSKSFSFPIAAHFARETSILSICFDEKHQGGAPIALSNSCIAFVETDRLLGFLVKI